MGLFSFLSNQKKKSNNDIDLAEALLWLKLYPQTQVKPDSYPISANLSRQIEKVIKQCPTRQSILEKVIELCGEPETARQRYICAAAYLRGKADYRENAIQSLEMYLANPSYERAYISARHTWGNKEFSQEEERKIHLAEMYSHLGKLYEAIHSYNQAIASYNKELGLTPFYPAPYCRISAVNIRKNQMSPAMNILLNAKKTRYYKPITYKTKSGETVTEDTFRKVIDNHIRDLEKKTEK